MSELVENVDAEVKKLKDQRKAWLNKLIALSGEACARIENGRFDLVEEALANCKDGLCEIQQTIKQDKTKRRARKGSGGGTNERTAAAGQAG